MHTALLLAFLTVVWGEDAAPLKAPSSDVGPAVVGPLMDAPHRGAQAKAPTEAFASIYTTKAFDGQDSVPWEVFNNSTGYMVPLGQVKKDYVWRNGTGPSICRSGSFSAVSQNDLNNYPASNIGRLYIQVPRGGWAWCSATQIAPDVLITAAHCVYDCSAGDWIKGGTYFDGRYQTSYRSSSPLKSFTAWTDCDGDDIPIYDFALIRLGTPIYKSAYPTTYAPTANAFAASSQAYVYSYPAETKPGNIPYYSVQDPVSPSYPTDSRAEVTLSIEAGSSGSSMFVANLPSSSFPASNMIVGITSYEYTAGACPNGFAIFQGPDGGYNPATLLKSLSA